MVPASARFRVLNRAAVPKRSKGPLLRFEIGCWQPRHALNDSYSYVCEREARCLAPVSVCKRAASFDCTAKRGRSWPAVTLRLPRNEKRISSGGYAQAKLPRSFNTLIRSRLRSPGTPRRRPALHSAQHAYEFRCLLRSPSLAIILSADAHDARRSALYRP